MPDHSRNWPNQPIPAASGILANNSEAAPKQFRAAFAFPEVAMRITDVWSNCAETAAAVVANREQKLARLRSSMDSMESEIRHAEIMVHESKKLLAEFTRQYLHEI